MNTPEEPAQGRIADLPLEERRSLEIEKERELADGLMRRHMHIATFRQRYLAVQFARALRAGPALRALTTKLRGG